MAENNRVNIRTLAANNPAVKARVRSVELLGAGKVRFSRSENGLEVFLPDNVRPNDISLVLKIKM